MATRSDQQIALGRRPALATAALRLVQGAMDTAVPVANTREWIAAMAELEMDYEYLEMGLGDHGNVITWGMDDIFEYFEQYSKP